VFFIRNFHKADTARFLSSVCERESTGLNCYPSSLLMTRLSPYMALIDSIIA